MLCSTSFVQHSLQKASNERRELLMVLLLFSSLQWDVHLSRSFRRYPHLTFPSATWKGIHAFSWQHVLPVGIFFFPLQNLFKAWYPSSAADCTFVAGVEGAPSGFLLSLSILKSQHFGCHSGRQKTQSSGKPWTFLRTTTCWAAKPVLWGPAMMQSSSGKKKNPDCQSSFPNPSIFNTAFCKSWPWCGHLNHCLVGRGTQRCCFHDKVSLFWQCSQHNLSFLKLTFQCWKS